MSNYSVFADFYDSLTPNVGYPQRADYFLELLQKFNHTAGLTLDLACGTGSFTLELAKRGIDVYGVDASPAMLSIAQQKAAEQGVNILFLCQKMQDIDLYGTVDTVFCTLDSINHLTKESDVRRTFQKVSLFMNPGGYFLFDMNTVYKHKEILADHTFVYDTDRVYCVWQNQYEAKTNRVGITLDFFERRGASYQRSTEHFYERAYETDAILRWLKEAGFRVDAVYNELTFSPPKPDSERLVIAAQKI